MILTVTLNPAVDKTYRIDEIQIGQVNRFDSLVSIPGGKGVNVAKIINQYGTPVTATGLIGGYAGEFIADSLKNMGINCAFTDIAQETRSNMNVLMKGGRVTELLEPGPEVTALEWALFLKQYEGLLKTHSIVAISGSACRGMSADCYRELITIAKANDTQVLLDTSGEGLRQGIKEKPYLCKPNRKELEYLVGRKLETFEEVLEAAFALQNEGIELVLVSLGEEGLLAVTKDKYYHGKVQGIVPVNTVGCGDSVIASFAMSLKKKASLKEAMIDACALSAANATTMTSGNIPMDVAAKLRGEVELTSGTRF